MRRVLIVTPPRIDSASRFPPSNAIRTVQSGSRPPPLSRSLQGRGLEASPMYGRRDRWDACKLHGETAVDRPPGRAAEARETLGERAVRGRDAAVGRRLTDAERPLGCRGRRPRHRGILSFAAWRRAVRLSAAVMGGFAHLRLTADAAPGDADRRASGGMVVRRTG